MSYYSVIPQEIISTIVSFLGDKDTINFEQSFIYIVNIINKDYFWRNMLIPYKEEYKLLKNVNEDSTKNMRQLFFMLKKYELFPKEGLWKSIGDILLNMNNVDEYILEMLILKYYPYSYNILSTIDDNNSIVNFIG